MSGSAERADAPLVVTLVDREVVGDVTQERYRIQPNEPDVYVYMTGQVATSATRTYLSVYEPRRVGATEDEQLAGLDFSGNSNHTGMSVDCDHGTTGAPNSETVTLVLGHLGAAMMALKFEE